MVVAGVLKEPFTAEPYRPEIVGQTREILLGKKSGLVSVEHKLRTLGLSIGTDRNQALLERVKAVSTQDRKEHTSELQSLMRISYAVFCLKKKNINTTTNTSTQ